MAGEEFSRLRKLLGKNQKELAEILGISRKAVESYEQGWRKVPANTERMLYFLLFKLREPLLAGKEACWETRDCPDSARRTCMTWLVQEGHFCWFFTGRLCAARQASQARQGGLSAGSGSRGESASREQIESGAGSDLSFCRACSVFNGMIDLIRKPDMAADTVSAAIMDIGADSGTGSELEPDPEGVTECP